MSILLSPFRFKISKGRQMSRSSTWGAPKCQWWSYVKQRFIIIICWYCSALPTHIQNRARNCGLLVSAWLLAPNFCGGRLFASLGLVHQTAVEPHIPCGQEFLGRKLRNLPTYEAASSLPVIAVCWGPPAVNLRACFNMEIWICLNMGCVPPTWI